MIYNSGLIRPQDVLRGSGMLEIALYGSDDWYNVGAVSEINVEETIEKYEAEDDTVYESHYSTAQNIKISFNQHEVLNSDIYSILRGIDTITEELDGTTEQIKIVSGNLTDLNEIKCRITSKLGNDLFYFIFHRGYVNNGKGFSYKSDVSEDDNRIKQKVEIVFLPDSSNSDEIYYTLQPAYYNEKLFHCQGDILTGITLDIDATNNMPISDWTRYDVETYDDSFYTPTAYYQSRMMYNSNGFTSMTYTGTGDANDVRISYRVGNSNDSLSDWTTPSNAIGAGTLNIGYKYFRYRFIFYSPLWSDTDSVLVNSIT